MKCSIIGEILNFWQTWASSKSTYIFSNTKAVS